MIVSAEKILLVLVGLTSLALLLLLPNEISGIFPWQVDRLQILLGAALLWALLALGLLIWGREKTVIQLSKKQAIAILGTAVLLYIVAYGYLAVTRHQTFNSTGYDLAINEQIVWNTLNGRFFASSLEVDNSFADHFRPFLAILLPVYAIFQTPNTLLIAQTIALSLGAIPLYQYARLKDLSPAAAAALGLVYLLYPAVGFINRFDFHIEAFAVAAFLAAFVAVERKRWRWATFWLIVPLLCKENLGLTVAMIGLYVLIFKRERKYGSGWIIVGIATFLLTSFWLIPTVRGEAADTLSRYAWLGDSPQTMISTLFFDFGRIFAHLTQPARLLSLLQQFLPLGFISLLGWPLLLPALPGLAINLLAEHHCQAFIYCQYAVPVLPFLFLAAAAGVARIKQPVAQDWFALLLVPLTLVALFVDNPFTEEEALPSATTRIGNEETVRQALAVVPEDGVLVTTNDYAPHLARRAGLFIIGRPTQRVAPTDPDIVFINLYDQQFIVCDEVRAYVSQLDPTRYGTTFRTGGLIVIERGKGSTETFQDFVDNWNNCAG